MLPQIAWKAVLEHDSRFDETFVYAVASTRVYCRPPVPHGALIAIASHFFLPRNRLRPQAFAPAYAVSQVQYAALRPSGWLNRSGNIWTGTRMSRRLSLAWRRSSE